MTSRGGPSRQHLPRARPRQTQTGWLWSALPSGLPLATPAGKQLKAEDGSQLPLQPFWRKRRTVPLGPAEDGAQAGVEEGLPQQSKRHFPSAGRVPRWLCRLRAPPCPRATANLFKQLRPEGEGCARI